MKPQAVAYCAIVGTAALSLTLTLALATHGIDGDVFARFLGLATGAAIAQLFVVRTSRSQAYHTTVVFLLAAVLLLPGALLPLVAIAQHIPDWLKHHHRLRYTVFNTANHALNMLAAAAVAGLVVGDASYPDTRWAIAGAAAVAVLVVSNHVVLAGVIAVTRDYTLRGTGLFTVASVAADLVPAALGIVLAAFWLSVPWLVPTIVIPLAVIHRSLIVVQRRMDVVAA